jgi:hypothetical protein
MGKESSYSVRKPAIRPTGEEGLSKGQPGSKARAAAVVIQEAAGKHIRELCVTDDYEEADEFCVVVKFDDDTELVLNLTTRLKFAVHYSSWGNGRQEVLKRYPARFLRK